jgi:predicted nucleic acid-binding protein
VAFFNHADRDHAAVARWFSGFRGQLLTTEAVITESAYLLADAAQHQQAALAWVQRARAAGLMQIHAVEDHGAIARLLQRYAALPCDYADATLIALAEKTGVSAIATIDQRDFSIYRIKGRKSFRILLPG